MCGGGTDADAMVSGDARRAGGAVNAGACAWDLIAATGCSDVGIR